MPEALRHFFPAAYLAAVLLMPLLSACSNYYTVFVDSLCDEELAAQAGPYFIEPGDPTLSADDLLFREVASMLKPVFAARGYVLVDEPGAARSIARISYWENAPQTYLESDVWHEYRPVSDPAGNTRYISVEVPVLSSYTVYNANLLIEARTAGGIQIWRTEAVSSAGQPGLRGLLSRMIPALKATLGTRTAGVRVIEVSEDSKGSFETEDITDDWR